MASFFAPPAPAPAAPTASASMPTLVPGFVADIYAVSPYGDFSPMNKMYYATVETAFALAMRYGAVPILLLSTPECPAPQQRFAVVEIPAGSALLPPSGARQSDPQKTMTAMDLTPFKQWALKWPSGHIANAGRLADYFRRIPEAQFPGLADHYCRIILEGEGVPL